MLRTFPVIQRREQRCIQYLVDRSVSAPSVRNIPIGLRINFSKNMNLSVLAVLEEISVLLIDLNSAPIFGKGNRVQ